MPNDSVDGVIYKDLGFMGYPNYRVGSDGSIWSCCNSRWGTGEWRQKKPTSNSRKYPHYVINLWKDNIPTMFLVSRLVALAFLGPCPEGMECCHSNGDGLDNRLENLRWGTHKNNMVEMAQHGHSQAGEKCHTAKLTVEDVKQIRYRYARKECRHKLAVEFRVTETTIRDIAKRRSWKHI